jgi:hypothetical protein
MNEQIIDCRNGRFHRAIETPFGKTDKILGAGTYIGLSVFFFLQSAIVSVVGDDFPQEYLDLLLKEIFLVLK